MAHGQNIVEIGAELWVDNSNIPVTSAEKVVDYNQIDSNNKPRTQESINAEALGKQDKLISGTNIKTVNNNSLLGSGNITINSGGGAGTLNTTTSSALSTQSNESLGGAVSLHKVSKTGNYNDLLNKPDLTTYQTKEAGKGLSTNDYTNADANAVESIIKDKEYSQENFSGLGRTYLPQNVVSDENILTQEMVSDANTVYIIQYDYTILESKDFTEQVSSSKSITYDGVTYFYVEVTINKGDSISVASGQAKLFYNATGNTWTALSENSYTALVDNQKMRVGVVAYSSNYVTYTITYGGLRIPANSVLKFEGGSINEGTIIGNNTEIDAGLVQIFGENVTLEGTWDVKEAYPEWFGAGKGNIIGYNAAGRALTNDTSAIQKATNAFDYVKLTGIYTITGVTVPQFHTIENSTTYVLDSDENSYAKGYKLMMKSTLKGGLIEVNSRFKYYVDSVNKRLVRPTNVVKETVTIPTTNSMVIGTATYYYVEITVPNGNIIKVTDEHDSYGYMISYELDNTLETPAYIWALNRDQTVTSTHNSYKVRLARHSSYYGDGVVTYDRVTSYSAIQGDFQDYNTFIKNRTSAITIGEESSNSRRVRVSGIQITAGSIYDANHNKIAGGAKDSYIAAAIKTEAENVSTKWNSFLMFTDIDVYGLFYGIVGNLRACRFNITMEQCYDNIDIYGDLNIFDLNGQTGVVLNLNPNETKNPDRQYDYFMYINGTSNVINDGIYDIGSKERNHQYMIKQSAYNVINSRALIDYNNIISNKTNGDFKAGTKYSWVGTHKHDYLLKGLTYTATLENSTYSGDIDEASLLDTPMALELTPTGTYNSSTRTYSNTMRLTITIDNIFEPYGVAALAQSNSMHFDIMKVYYGQSNGVDTLVGAISRSSTPYIDWNPDYSITRNMTPKTLKLVFEGNRQVVWFGLKVYGKTTQNLNSGTVRPTKDLTVGQQFFDTSLVPAKPVWWNGAGWSDLINVVDLPTTQYIDYFDTNVIVPITNKGVSVSCLTNGTFELSGTCTSSGGQNTPLTDVFSLSARTYTMTVEVLSGTVSGLTAYVMNSSTDTAVVSGVGLGSTDITIPSTTSCYIGLQFTSGVTYTGATVKITIADYATFSLNGVISDILWRLDQLEGN